MREEKTVSEREAVMREREAFDRGARWRESVTTRSIPEEPIEQRSISSKAACVYPLPKRVVPRVVRFENGNDVQTVAKHVGSTGGLFTVTRCGATVLSCGNILALRHEISSLNDVRLLADLLAHPTEEIDDDGSDRE